MPMRTGTNQHSSEHGSSLNQSFFLPSQPGPIHVGSRRWFLQAGLAGLGGLSLPGIPAAASQAAALSQAAGGSRKAVILFWLSGGPSHIDMWDPKPDAPSEIRSPFAPISTKVPGMQLTEHLPLQASIAEEISVIRSVDSRASDHTPITMQAGNPLARRTNDGNDGAGYPSMGSIISKFRGANEDGMPAFVGLAKTWTSDVWGAGSMGSQYEPVKGLELTGKFRLPKGISMPRLTDRDRLRGEFDRLRHDLDQHESLERFGRFSQQAYEMVVSGKVEKAFNIGEESDATRDWYGRASIGEKALLARRLVESGVTFVLVSGAWGYFDHHGDDVRWGGIEKGLKPLLPRADRAFATLVSDLKQRGLLDDTLVMMMGEFGRSPVINKEAGRDHWQPVMSMVMAGGGMPHGQVIGSTDSRGGSIKSSIVRPQDLAATTFKHLNIDQNSHWTNTRGRPIPIVAAGGRPIPELC